MTLLKNVVGLGEILWDLLPSGRQLGGAPANFAYCSHLLGDCGVVASRVGQDELGADIRQRLLGLGISDQFLQVDPEHPTSTVQVQVDGEGQPRFEIVDAVAWDFLEWTPTWKALAQSADAVCFGSLAQRHAQSRETILKFLDATRPDTLRIFDVNLRQNFYSAEVVRESLERANVMKLNHEEVPRIADLLSISAPDSSSFCAELIRKFALQLICITRGINGSLLCTKDQTIEHAGFTVQVADTVGAGDAFTAALVHELLCGSSLQQMNDTANRMGAWVASRHGAMPKLPEVGLAQALADVQPR
jgi:fructokinase